jgi:hypothetical protein
LFAAAQGIQETVEEYCCLAPAAPNLDYVSRQFFPAFQCWHQREQLIRVNPERIRGRYQTRPKGSRLQHSIARSAGTRRLSRLRPEIAAALLLHLEN